MITHWHINTTHKEGTPPYPDKNAIYIYLTGCAKELESTEQGESYEITQFENDRKKVNCKPCAVWMNWLFKQRSRKA